LLKKSILLAEKAFSIEIQLQERNQDLQKCLTGLNSKNL